MILVDFDTLAKEALTFIGEVSKTQAKTNMKKTSYGRVYMVGGKKHIASKRGDAPNNMTGALSKTIDYHVMGKTMIFGIGDEIVDYAKYLEGYLFRPNIVPSVLQNKDKIEMGLTKLLNDNIRFLK